MAVSLAGGARRLLRVSGVQMSRTRGRIDANQGEIVSALRIAGVSVLSLAPMGKGCPDLLCGYHGRNYLLEVKDGSKIPSERKLTTAEADFFGTWQGQVCKVESIDDVLGWLAVWAKQ